MTTPLLEQEKQTTAFSFTGKGKELFTIQLVNLFLTAITLGLYYPWAKAKTLQYLYRKTEMAGSPFTFHGTGKEMFAGFIKGLALLAILYGVMIYGYMSGSNTVKAVCFLTFFAGIMLLLPVAIHGAMKYRTSRTSWRGIHMGYRGSASHLLGVYLLHLFFTIITFGIYGAWFVVKVRKEIIENVRFGSAHLRYTGEGSDLLVLHLKGYFLTLLTLGVYAFWYAKDLLRFYTDNIVVVQDESYSRLQCQVSGWEYLKLAVGNLLLIIFTLGLGIAWATTRTMSFVLNNATLIGTFDPDTLVQTEEAYTNAMYEDIADVLDIGLV
ncbi:YjgN family protein [Pontibacter liquoris]|uniref:YjgN family protein n=1 Tax=Pontibacter liquoris TaxID=2905677 RepID=UPI001FA761BB|nr:DUF898 family protein [Pontibacter liquoris]